MTIRFFPALRDTDCVRRRLCVVVVVCNTAGGPGARVVGPPTLHGGPVVLRPVRATPCFIFFQLKIRLLFVCSAHIRGHKHKKRLASLRKQARLVAADKTNGDREAVDGHTDVMADSYAIDNVDEIVSD